MKVLIAEDNTMMRNMIKTVMKDPANEFFECTDGLEAVQTYERVHPDCVVMDVEMKPVDGITATRQIKKFHPEARVIIVTNYGDVRTREAARLAGADGFVLKENMLDIPNAITALK